MKTRLVIIMAAVALMATSCRFANHVKEIAEDIATMPVTAENVAERAENLGSDVALVTSVSDTQYVLFRQGRQVFKKEHAYRCYSIRYVQTGDDSWRASIVQSKLEEPEQPMLLTRTADNALTLTVDSIVIAVTNIENTDSTVTFDFGFDNADGPVRFDRAATLYLYGKARNMKDPFAETSIQQMLSLSLLMEYAMGDCEDMDEAYEALEDAGHDLEEAEHDLEDVARAQAFGERYADYSRLDSLACALGFANKESKADNDHLVFKVWGGLGGSKKCYARMERMSEEAATCHTAGYTVQHKPHHRGCTFTVRW